MIISRGTWGRGKGFTLIEIMLVIGILALVLGMGAPSFYHAMQREPMRMVLRGLTESCTAARSQAILQGRTTSLVFHPRERTFAVEGVSGGGAAGTIPESIGVEMLDINMMEFRDADAARVRFFANGTCDEFTIVLRSDRNEWRKISLESTTGVLSIGEAR